MPQQETVRRFKIPLDLYPELDKVLFTSNETRNWWASHEIR